jgi:hypothetical protein
VGSNSLDHAETGMTLRRFREAGFELPNTDWTPTAASFDRLPNGHADPSNRMESHAKWVLQ